MDCVNLKSAFWFSDLITVCLLCDFYRKYIENVGPQELKLYITKIENVDAGDYSCTGIMEGAQQEAKVKLLIFSEYLTN